MVQFFFSLAACILLAHLFSSLQICLLNATQLYSECAGAYVFYLFIMIFFFLKDCRSILVENVIGLCVMFTFF